MNMLMIKCLIHIVYLKIVSNNGSYLSKLKKRRETEVQVFALKS